MKQDATILADANDLTKEEQVQHRGASRARRLAQMNESQEKIGNIPLQISNNEEQNKSVTSKETKENGMEENNAQSMERSDQPMSEFAGSQAEATEMT